MSNIRAKKLKSKNLKKCSVVVTAIGLTIFALYTLTLAVSFGWTFLSSLKAKFEYPTNIIGLPEKWLFSNYVKAFTELSAGGNNAFVMLANSLWLSLAGPTISIFTSAMASYVMAKYKFPGKSLIWGIMITIMIIPVYGATASTYKMYGLLGIYDSPLILITSVCGLGGNMMMIAAFESVSTTFMEASFLDGAGHAKTFFYVILPQMTGLLSALWIMAFITEWNNYMKPIMYLPSFPTFSSGLYIYQIQEGRKVNMPILFAGTLLCTIPALSLFVTFQDKFLNMSYGGGIKG